MASMNFMRSEKVSSDRHRVEELMILVSCVLLLMFMRNVCVLYVDWNFAG